VFPPGKTARMLVYVALYMLKIQSIAVVKRMNMR
jgi:hypothetical protein